MLADILGVVIFVVLVLGSLGIIHAGWRILSPETPVERAERIVEELSVEETQEIEE